MSTKTFYGLIGGLVILAGPVSAVELRLKWEEGKRYTFSQAMSSAMTMAMQGVAMATQTDIDQEMHYDVAAHEKGSEVKMFFDSMKMSVRMNGQEMMAYDSKDGKGGGGMLGQAVKPLFEAEVSAIYDKDGKVVEVGGLEGLEGMEQLGMGKQELDQMVRQTSLLLPDGEVEPGDTWQAEMDLPLGQLSKEPATMCFELKFEGMEKKGEEMLAKISIGGTVKMEVDGEGEAPLSLEAKNVSGVMLFDVALGQPRETRMQMELEMGVPEGVPVAEDAPGKLPISLLSTQKLLSIGDAG